MAKQNIADVPQAISADKLVGVSANNKWVVVDGQKLIDAADNAASGRAEAIAIHNAFYSHEWSFIWEYNDRKNMLDLAAIYNRYDSNGALTRNIAADFPLVDTSNTSKRGALFGTKSDANIDIPVPIGAFRTLMKNYTIKFEMWPETMTTGYMIDVFQAQSFLYGGYSFRVDKGAWEIMANGVSQGPIVSNSTIVNLLKYVRVELQMRYSNNSSSLKVTIYDGVSTNRVFAQKTYTLNPSWDKGMSRFIIGGAFNLNSPYKGRMRNFLITSEEQ